MTALQGRFVWYELMTTDTAAAARFYGDVVGWGAQDAGHPGFSYTLLTTGGVPQAGLMALADTGNPDRTQPAWIGSIAVDDVDAMTARVAAAGGTVHRDPADIPNVGRFAVVADPQGAAFILYRPAPECAGAPPEGEAAMAPGHIGWHELHAADGPAAFAFYAELFGWTVVEDMDMGPMGTYRIFAPAGGAMCGGILTKTPEVPAPVWLYYVSVDDIDAAKARVEAGGGTVAHGPHPVPGGIWILQCQDPQGGWFALVGPRK